MCASLPSKPVDQTTAAALEFERAKSEFDAGKFVTALQHAREVERLLSGQELRTTVGASRDPIYSVIVVTYRDIPAVRDAFLKLAPYSRLEGFELVIVNNGNPAAAAIANHLFSHYTWVEIGFNYGCSGARNIGAQASRGEFLIFVDDDGLLAESAVENLIEVAKTFKAVTVRGRILPKSPSGFTGKNYDLGDQIVISGPNAECLMICRRDEYINAGGFDSLLAGHEGWALCSKLYPRHNPQAFLYAPQAVLYHDYAENAEHYAAKKEKFERNKRYIEEQYPLALQLMSFFSKNRTALRPQLPAEDSAQ
jgi:glycosyltransferase involved in cell wall biosynthesis